MNKVYGYDTNIYETSIGNIKKDESYITTDELTYQMLVQKIEQLQQENQQLKKQKCDVVEYIKTQQIIFANYDIVIEEQLDNILRKLGEINE